MEPVVVASNRGPLSFHFDDQGTPVPTGPAGGLAGTLQPLLEGSGSTWISSSMSDADQAAAEQGLMQGQGIRLVNVRPAPDVYRKAYDVISNATLWFCFHHLFDLSRRPRFDRLWREAWEGYREFNRQFADSVVEQAGEGAVVLIQDYHLMLTGQMVIAKRPDLKTVHFLHTPFCAPELLRVLPSDVAQALLQGMGGFGTCGFHASRWEQCFRGCWKDPDLVGSDSPPPRSFVAPIGPVPEAVTAEAASEPCQRARQGLREMVGERHLVVRVDRVELSKNILRGCWALEELLETRPHWREKVMLLALAYPSREGLADYLAYRSEIEHTVARINERWGNREWTPIMLDVADDRARSLAALCEYDVLLVNPLRDGMNLVAKEGPLINTRHGVLALSREAGAWDELGSAAVGLNPFDVSDTSRALDTALGMESEERRRRAAQMVTTIRSRPASAWLDDQLAAARARKD